MKISIKDLYHHYRSIGFSHIDAIRKLRADMRQNSLVSTLSE